MNREPYYGIVGNGETIALISSSGNIDWWCLPRFDSKLFYARALDPVNGASCGLHFIEQGSELLAHQKQQQYTAYTNVLETHLQFEGLRAVVSDFMPWRGISELMNDKRLLYRVITLTNTSEIKKQVTVRARSSAVTEDATADLGHEHVFFRDESFVVGSFLKETEDIALAPGEKHTCAVVLVYGETAAEVKSKLRKLRHVDISREQGLVEEFWRNWLARGKSVRFRQPGYDEMYHRSLLMIKLLTYEKNGAILAAPTASFPATPGGSENWDYRFMWIRDSFFACRALLKAGHPEEVKKQLELFFGIQQKNGHWKLPFYTIDGEEPGSEIIVEGLRGPHGEEQIRLNNEAKDQLQLDSEGSVLHLAYLYYNLTKDKDFIKAYWPNINRTANWIVRNHARRENGLWELREKEHKPLAHWTYGKVLCHAGLRSVIELAEELGLSAPDEWYIADRKLHKWIIESGWSPHRKAYVQTFDLDAQMDVSALAVEDYGLLSPVHPAMRSTAREMQKRLGTTGHGVKRFEDATLPFYLPTLWLPLHFIRTGERDKARRYVDAALGGSTDLSLCAEHFDPLRGRQHGNFPQTFSAAAFVEALLALKESRVSAWLRKMNQRATDLFTFLSRI